MNSFARFEFDGFSFPVVSVTLTTGCSGCNGNVAEAVLELVLAVAVAEPEPPPPDLEIAVLSASLI